MRRSDVKKALGSFATLAGKLAVEKVFKRIWLSYG